MRDDAGGQRVAEEDVRIATQREDALLDAGAAGIVQPDDGRTHLHRQIHDLHDLRGVGLGERSTEHREVLRERIDGTSVDATVTRNDAVAGHELFRHAEVTAAMRDQLVDFLEGSGVERKSMRSRAVSFPPRAAAADDRLPACLGPPLELFEVFDGVHAT